MRSRYVSYLKKLAIAAITVIFPLLLIAQPIPPRSIEDSVIGWMKVYNFKGTKESRKVEDKLYSPAQISLTDSFANWIQASYMPKGGLGDVKRSVSGKLGLYNKHEAYLPQSYGAYAKTYVFLQYNSSRKIVPQTDHHLYWGVYANQVPGWAIPELCSPSQYYFTMPSFETSAGSTEETKKIHDMSKLDNLKKYTSFWVRSVETGGGTDYVLLSRNNQSPFIKITKGEYLQSLESSIPRFYEEEKRKLIEAVQGDKERVARDMKFLDEKIERFRAGIRKNREKYRNRLEELALTNAQPSFNDADNGRDVFSNGYLTDPESVSGRIPVYKIDPAMAALCKKDKPQWILVSWWWSPVDPVEKYMHESIVNNFNFDYVYNFFFDPEKVKGQLYKPLRSPTSKEAVVVGEVSEAGKKNAADKNIHFFDDFSTTVIGKTPIGWKTILSFNGSASVVTKLDGLDGNWAVMAAGYTIMPNLLKKPLPQDFTLSFELVAHQNFSWGAKGLALQLSKETSPGNAESYLLVRLRPGFDGRDGEITIETKFPYPPGFSNGSKWMAAPGFSNNKKNNHITVTVKKTGQTLQFFIDKNKVAEYEKAIPEAHLFNAMSFYTGGGTSENDQYYISNIKITKD